MNRLRYLFTLLLLIISSFSYSQSGYLFIKKGFNKKRTYTEWEMIRVKLQDGKEKQGTITLLKDSSIFINGKQIPLANIKQVILIKRPLPHLPDSKTMLLIGAGSVLTSIGLSLNNKDDRIGAMIAGPVIGFGPIMVRHFGMRLFRVLSRKKFTVGKKFHLQILDFRISSV